MIVKGRFSNLFVWGDTQIKGTTGALYWGETRLRLGRDAVVLRQARGALDPPRSAASLPVISTEVEWVHSGNCGERTAIDKARNLAFLLGFATMEHVQLSQLTIGFQAHQFLCMPPMLSRTPLLDTADGASVRHFVEITWQPFRRLIRERRVDIAMHYLAVGAGNSLPLEARLTLAFIALESLKHSFAKCKYDMKRGRFVENGRPLSFEQLTKRMLLEAGIRVPLSRLVEIRNSLVHTGFAGTNSRLLPRYEHDVRRIAIRYILRILGYRGQYAIGRHYYPQP